MIRKDRSDRQKGMANVKTLGMACSLQLQKALCGWIIFRYHGERGRQKQMLKGLRAWWEIEGTK